MIGHEEISLYSATIDLNWKPYMIYTWVSTPRHKMLKLEVVPPALPLPPPTLLLPPPALLLPPPALLPPPPEEWRGLEEFPGYKVSTLGRLMLSSGRISTARPNPEGYVRTSFASATYTRTHVYVHILVATAWIPNTEKKPVVNHINGIRHDNRPCNLEWTTVSENTGREKKLFARTTHAGRPILQYDKEGTFLRRWDKGIDAATAFGVKPGSIAYLCKGVKPCPKGFIWRYEDVTDLPGEVWTWSQFKGEPIPVSSFGRICTPTGKRTFGSICGTGYMVYKATRIHRLVCYGFCPRSDWESLDVDHKDGNKTNNHVDNLEWVTSAENTRRHFASRK